MITAAQMIRIDERSDTREAVGEPSEADELEVLNDYLSASIILDELQGWDPYTHTIETPEGTYYHVTMTPDSSTPALLAAIDAETNRLDAAYRAQEQADGEG